MASEESGRPRRRKDGLHGPGIDLLYQMASESYDAVHEKAQRAAETFGRELALLFMRLIDEAVPGGEIDLALQKHSDGPATSFDAREVAMLADLRAFYRRCPPNQQALLPLLFASLQPGVGIYLGINLDGQTEAQAVGAGHDARGALPTQQRREGRAS